MIEPAPATLSAVAELSPSRTEDRAWWWARQNGWMIVAGLVASSVLNGVIVWALFLLERLTATSEFFSLPTGLGLFDSLELFWRNEHLRGWFGEHEAAGTFATVVTAITLIVCSGVSITRVHRHESIASSLHRAFAGIVSLVLPIAMHVLVCGALIVSVRSAIFWNDAYPYEYIEGAPWIIVGACGVVRVTRTMAIVTDALAGPAPEIPRNRCQDCGYDLSGHIDLPRCGECGASTASSLVRGIRRFPNFWEAKRKPKTWIAETLQVLLRPRAFYSTLRMHNSLDSARAFGRWHFLLIGMCAAWWMFGCGIIGHSWTGYSDNGFIGGMYLCAQLLVIGSGATFALLLSRRTPIRCAVILVFSAAAFQTLRYPLVSVFSPETRTVSLMCFAISFAAPMVCWLGQRINGTLAALPFLGRDGLPDGRWAETIIAYESAFCWFFCIGWGLLGWSYVAWDSWISELIGTELTFRVLGMPAEPAAIVGVALLGGLIWQIRFWIALRAVRWANE